jgi:hypothetical protein
MHIGFDLTQATTLSWVCSVPLAATLIGAAFAVIRSSRRKNADDGDSAGE